MVKRGSVLITALLLVAVITVLALALLAKNTLQYTGAERQAASVRAYQMALAGLEDVRVKLDLDTNYPPLSDPEQTYFSYTETVLDLALAATLECAGVSRLATFNGRDFAVFDFLEVIEP